MRLPFSWCPMLLLMTKVDNEDQMALGNSDVPHIIAYPTESEETKDSLVSKSDNRNEQASALSPASSANESPEKRPDSQVSTGKAEMSVRFLSHSFFLLFSRMSSAWHVCVGVDASVCNRIQLVTASLHKT